MVLLTQLLSLWVGVTSLYLKVARALLLAHSYG